MDTDRANTLTEVRSEALNESTRSLLLINGGGAVAVATWLQAVWSEEAWAASMLRPQVVGVALLLAGALFAAVCPFLRYLSFLHPKTVTPFKNPVWWVNAGATVLSPASFIAGMVFVVCGAWRALP